MGIEYDVQPKLSIELVPKTSWFTNLRSLISPEEWDALRQSTYRRANYRCEICGEKGPDHPVECHEVWHYDDKKHRQILIRLIALCPACHQVKHLGFAVRQSKGEQAFEHLMQVNGWTEYQALRYIETVGKKQKERSKFPWTVDISIILSPRNQKIGGVP